MAAGSGGAHKHAGRTRAHRSNPAAGHVVAVTYQRFHHTWIARHRNAVTLTIATVDQGSWTHDIPARQRPLDRSTTLADTKHRHCAIPTCLTASGADECSDTDNAHTQQPTHMITRGGHHCTRTTAPTMAAALLIVKLTSVRLRASTQRQCPRAPPVPPPLDQYGLGNPQVKNTPFFMRPAIRLLAHFRAPNLKLKVPQFATVSLETSHANSVSTW